MKNCLIFGGNGFMGFETVSHLLHTTTPDEISLTLLNRGKSWDSWDKKSKLPFIPRTFTVNRDKPLTECQELVEFVQQTELFDTVIDFSGYKPYAVEQAIELLQGKVGLYIYISSDSVYEVCEFASDGKSTRETCAVRPSSEDKRRELNKQDKYGHKKLACEELLQKQRADGGFSYTALRLSDVIGPRDSTDRWYQYQLWVKLSDCLKIPVVLPYALQTQSISFVYCVDVAKLIGQLILDSSVRERSRDEAFNLGFTDCPSLTVKDMLCKIQDCLGLKNVTYEFSKKDVPQIYPSVENGPIDTSKAVAMLSWSPVPSAVAFEETVIFYEDCQNSKRFTNELWENGDELLQDFKEIFDKSLCKKIKLQLEQWLGKK